MRENGFTASEEAAFDKLTVHFTAKLLPDLGFAWTEQCSQQTHAVLLEDVETSWILQRPNMSLWVEEWQSDVMRNIQMSERVDSV